MKDISIVFLLTLAILGIFGLSAVIFVPILGSLPFGIVAGGLSNLWLWGTIGVAIFIYFVIIKILKYS